VLADLSGNHVEKQALLCGFASERVRLDYGIDLMVQTHYFDWLKWEYYQNGGIPFPAFITRKFLLVDDWSTDYRYCPQKVKFSRSNRGL
jgi:hypothetical protein